MGYSQYTPFSSDFQSSHVGILYLSVSGTAKLWNRRDSAERRLMIIFLIDNHANCIDMPRNMATACPGLSSCVDKMSFHKEHVEIDTQYCLLLIKLGHTTIA